MTTTHKDIFFQEQKDGEFNQQAHLPASTRPGVIRDGRSSGRRSCGPWDIASGIYCAIRACPRIKVTLIAPSPALIILGISVPIRLLVNCFFSYLSLINFSSL